MSSEAPGLSRFTVSFGIALAIASVVNGLLVIAKEKSHAVMAGMQSLTGHHWITHSLAVILLFLGLGFGLAKSGPQMTSRSLFTWLFSGVLIGAVLIVGFYLIGD
jgi:hypothetical protein